MKHDQLRSIAHNAAASLASGCSFLVGVYDLDVFREASQSPRDEIVVDFLRGTVSGTPLNSRLPEVVAKFPKAIEGLCERHGVQIAGISEMLASYRVTPQGGRFLVTVADKMGRRTETDYGGYDGQRTKVLDDMGRLRPRPVRHV
jgi:hypothetical protein